MHLKPNIATRTYAVPCGVVTTQAVNLIAIAADHLPNLYLAIVAAAFLAIAVLLEMHMLSRLPKEHDDAAT